MLILQRACAGSIQDHSCACHPVPPQDFESHLPRRASINKTRSLLRGSRHQVRARRAPAVVAPSCAQRMRVAMFLAFLMASAVGVPCRMLCPNLRLHVSSLSACLTLRPTVRSQRLSRSCMRSRNGHGFVDLVLPAPLRSFWSAGCSAAGAGHQKRKTNTCLRGTSAARATAGRSSLRSCYSVHECITSFHLPCSVVLVVFLLASNRNPFDYCSGRLARYPLR